MKKNQSMLALKKKQEEEERAKMVKPINGYQGKNLYQTMPHRFAKQSDATKEEKGGDSKGTKNDDIKEVQSMNEFEINFELKGVGEKEDESIASRLF